jgi:hypothetical protein
MKRIYHPYKKWEDYNAGMWSAPSKADREKHFQRAIDFTGDADLYGSYMMRVVKEWRFACEHNLTNPSMNKLAWIGHCAACLAFRCPEYVTREAWGELTDEQRTRADAKAQEALDYWMEHRKRRGDYSTEQGALEL